VTPRALATDEIPVIIEQYRQTARNALAAGFDGVEIHAADGYLLEQFLRDSTNKRTDACSGSRENRARFLFEVTEAVAGVCGGQRVGVRFSPVANGAALDSNPAATYTYAVAGLNAFDLAYIHVIEGNTQGLRHVPDGFDLQILRRTFEGLYMANNGYNRELALDARRHNLADLASAILLGRSSWHPRRGLLPHPINTIKPKDFQFLN
jgi:N-ethylmaleimide reductase